MTTRSHVHGLVRSHPFHPFALNFDNGDRVDIEHPENIAFDVSENGRDALYVLSNQLQYFSTFSAITSVAVIDHGQPSN